MSWVYLIPVAIGLGAKACADDEAKPTPQPPEQPPEPCTPDPRTGPFSRVDIVKEPTARNECSSVTQALASPNVVKSHGGTIFFREAVHAERVKVPAHFRDLTFTTNRDVPTEWVAGDFTKGRFILVYEQPQGSAGTPSDSGVFGLVENLVFDGQRRTGGILVEGGRKLLKHPDQDNLHIMGVTFQDAQTVDEGQTNPEIDDAQPQRAALR